MVVATSGNTKTSSRHSYGLDEWEWMNGSSVEPRNLCAQLVQASTMIQAGYIQILLIARV